MCFKFPNTPFFVSGCVGIPKDYLFQAASPTLHIKILLPSSVDSSKVRLALSKLDFSQLPTPSARPGSAAGNCKISCCSVR